MSLDACAAMVAKGDADRFAAAMLAPLPQRGHLMALYAFNLEVACAPWVTREPMIAEMRLQWWRDVLDEVFAKGPVRRHEVATPLAETIRVADLPRAPLDAIIDARREDIGRRPMTPEEAFAYCDATAGNLMVLAVKALGVGGDARHAARFLGQAQGVANFGMALPRLYGQGWRALDGWDGAALANGQPTNALVGAIAALGDAGLVALLKARERHRTLPRAAQPALAAAWQAHNVLRAMTHWRRRQDFMNRSFETSEPRRRLAILLRGILGSV